MICVPCSADHHDVCTGCSCDDVAHGRRFVVGDTFWITGRGPVIIRPNETSKAARDAGQLFALGETIRCGHLEAVVVGIERALVMGPAGEAQGALLLRGVELDELEEGQVWI